MIHDIDLSCDNDIDLDRVLSFLYLIGTKMSLSSFRQNDSWVESLLHSVSSWRFDKNGCEFGFDGRRKRTYTVLFHTPQAGPMQ